MPVLQPEDEEDASGSSGLASPLGESPSPAHSKVCLWQNKTFIVHCNLLSRIQFSENILRSHVVPLHIMWVGTLVMEQQVGGRGKVLLLKLNQYSLCDPYFLL